LEVGGNPVALGSPLILDADSNFTYTLTYTPNPGYYNNPPGSDLDSLLLSVVDGLGLVMFPVAEVDFLVDHPNQQPTITCGSTCHLNDTITLTTPLVVMGISIQDDSSAGDFTTELLVNCTACNISFNSLAGCQVIGNNTKNLKLLGFLTQIDAALAAGLIYTPVHTGTDTLYVTFNDLGNISPSGLPHLTATLKFLVTVNPAGGTQQSAVFTSAFVGVSSVLSMGVFGAYKIMKKNKLIPEDADPWENDEMFDATLDNPLFSGAPAVGMTALYAQE